jgi:glycosyltransferase involved in cell wall biosynthesis
MIGLNSSNILEYFVLEGPFAPVTAVMPCFRCAKTVGRALDSLLSQIQKPAEVLLVDDASRDETLTALYEFQKKYPAWVRVIELEENAGAGAARNTGWENARYPYIAFLDSDDAWHPRKIEIQYAHMKANTSLALCGHGHRVLAVTDGLPAWDVTTSPAKSIGKWDMLIMNKFVTPSVMLRRDLPFRFRSNKRHMEDHMLWLEIVCNGLETVKLSEELTAIYKRAFGEAGLSSQMWPMERQEIDNYMELKKDGHISIFQMYALLAYSLVKYLRRLFLKQLYRI